MSFGDSTSMDTAAINPGVAQNHRSTGFSLSTSWQNVLSRTITCPAAGYVLAIGTCELASQTNSYTGGDISVSSTSGSPSSVQNSWGMDRVNDTSAHTTVPIQHVMQVTSSGDKTFYLVARESTGGNTRTDGATLTLVYIPKAYGAISP